MEGQIKNGTTVYYFTEDEGVVKDEIVSYDKETDMYELKESGQWESLESLFTNKRKCKEHH